MRNFKYALCSLLAVLFVLWTFCGCSEKAEVFDITKITLSEEQLSAVAENIDYTLTEGDFSGNALITLNDQTVYEKSYGYADKNKKSKINSSYVFQISSLTKGFTGVAVLQLADDGKLSLEDTLDKYFDGYDYLKDITVSQLLDASVNLGSYSDEILPDSDKYNYLKKAVKQAAKGKFSQSSIQEYITEHILETGNSDDKVIGTYPNSNYYLLGRIIERSSGLEFFEYIRENILDKLGMDNTDFVSVNDDLSGYNQKNDIWIKCSDTQVYSSYSFMYSSFGMKSTAEDMRKFYGAILNNELTDSDLTGEILSGRTDFNYGFNVDGRNIYIGGNTLLHSSFVYINTETLETSLLLSNFAGDIDLEKLSKESYNAVNSKVNGIILEQS